jgi:hypothetical protein
MREYRPEQISAALEFLSHHEHDTPEQLRELVTSLSRDHAEKRETRGIRTNRIRFAVIEIVERTLIQHHLHRTLS